MSGVSGTAVPVPLLSWKSFQAAVTAKRPPARQSRWDPGVQMPVVPSYGESVWHQFTLLHPQRDALRGHLDKCGVGTEIIYPGPMHRQECYASLGYAAGSIPVAESVSARCVSLPIFPELTDEQVDYVIQAANNF